MTSRVRFLSVVAAPAVLGLWMAQQPARAADAPKVSTFAPAEDLARQADLYIESMKSAVAGEEDYKDDKDKLARDSNTLVVIALALGLHDQDNKYKASAGALMKAAQDVAAAKDYASARKAVAALETAATAKSDVALKWEKAASLPELMKQVPVIDAKLKHGIKGKNFAKKAKDTAGHAAVIAVIAQGAMADGSATKNDDQVQQWQKFSAAMRDGAAAVGAATGKADEPATAAAMKKLDQSCEACHAVFKPDVVQSAK